MFSTRLPWRVICFCIGIMEGNSNCEAGACIANSILRYLRGRPRAADTLTGITRWWLLQQRIEQSTAEVAAALAILKDQRLVRERRMPDGQVLYVARVESAAPKDAKEEAQ
jgi:hypothetical protein